MRDASARDQVFPIVGVGASAGGLEALRELLSGHTELKGMAIVVVQHLDPNHDSMMAQLMDGYTSMDVRQITDGEIVEPGTVYVIPPGHGLDINDGVLQLVDFHEPRGMRRPIDDFLFRLAEDRGSMAAGVILSGTGADGSRGLRAIKESGGLAIAQDPQDARYDGMPSAAVSTGLVDYIEKARSILPVVADFFERHGTQPDAQDEASEIADQVESLCQMLHEKTGHDFSGYKRTTLVRRIERRMKVLGYADAASYAAALQGDDKECVALFRDLLINVTRFFRDADAFEALREKAIDPLVRGADDDDEIRIWVAGCSSGEEAYSIAMAFRSAMEKHRRFPTVSILASDIDEAMLAIAREGAYPISAIADIPQDFQERYTVPAGDHFVVAPTIRDMVRFSVHSLIKDPPFSRIDLISCRNLLIYFDERLQRAIMPLMHYSLRPDGYLFLGTSESIGRFDDLFEDIELRARLFRRRSVRPSYPLDLPSNAARRRTATKPRERKTSSVDWLETSALEQLLQRHAPVSLLLDASGLILAKWGPVGRYFDFPDGSERKHYAAVLAKPGLRDVIGPLIRQTAADGRPHVAQSIKVSADFGSQEVRVICEPTRESAMLMVIRETGVFQVQNEGDILELDQSDSQVHLLENELRTMRHRLRTTVEELETANEELKSSNEEMMSMNEELQSTNEELTTVNDELKSKVDQLTVANADLKNFFDSTQLAVVVVDDDLVVRSHTDAAETLFALSSGNRNPSLANLHTSLDTSEYIDLAQDVASKGVTAEARMRDSKHGTDYALRIIPYRRHDGTVDGATLVFTDITEALALEQDLADQRQRLELAIEVAKIGVWETDMASGEVQIDEMERELLGIEPDREVDLADIMKLIDPLDHEMLEQDMLAVGPDNREFQTRFRVNMPDGSSRWMRGLGRYVERDGRGKIIGVTFDVTAETRLLEERGLHLGEMNHRIKNLFSVVSAMVSNAEREADTIKEFGATLRGRIAALDRAHSLMLQTDAQQPVAFSSLLERITAPARGQQPLTMKGPEITIPVKSVTPLVLILHEWVTNASKYGAFSWGDGAMQIDWSVEEGDLNVVWREKIPPTDHENPSGFGSRLIEAAAMQLGAELTREINHDEFVATLKMPMPS